MRTVTCFAGEGDGASVTQAYFGESVTLRTNTFTRRGYTFAGIINGADGKLLPQGNASRAQAATMLMRCGAAK